MQTEETRSQSPSFAERREGGWVGQLTEDGGCKLQVVFASDICCSQLANSKPRRRVSYSGRTVLQGW